VVRNRKFLVDNDKTLPHLGPGEPDMTKADLVERAAEALGPRVTKKDCGLVVDAFLDAVKDALERGEGIEIRGFGTFKVRRRERRIARNPKTGEPVEVPARAAPVFQPSSLLRDRVIRRNASAQARTCVRY